MPSERSSPARGSSSLGTPDAGPPVRFGGSGGFSPRPYPSPAETEALRQICGPFLEQRSEETAEVFGEVAEPAMAAGVAGDVRGGDAHKVAGPAAHGGDVGLAVGDDADLEIYEEATEVEIGGAEDGGTVVDEHGFGVQHAGLIKEDASAGSVEFAQVVAAGVVGDAVVGTGGDDEGDVFAGAGFDEEGALEDLVRDEVGSDDPDAVLGLVDEGENALVERVAGDVGAAGDDLHVAGAGGGDGGGVALGLERFE